MITIGIDPGVSGAIGWVYGEACGVQDTPSIVVGKASGKGNKTEIDIRESAEIVKRLQAKAAAIDEPIVVYLEAVHAMIGSFSKGKDAKAGWSGQTNFALGRSLGIWEGILASLQVPAVKVSPQRWKKALGLPSDKQQCRLAAIDRFPAMATRLKRMGDHNRAEAILLAWYGQQGIPVASID